MSATVGSPIRPADPPLRGGDFHRPQVAISIGLEWRFPPARAKLCVLALQVQRTAEIRTGLPWARIAHLLGTLKAVRYVAESRTIVQRTKIVGELADLLKKLGIPIPKQLLAVTEAADTPATA